MPSLVSNSSRKYSVKWTMNNCKNCHEPFKPDSNYCPACGQVVIDQINWSFLKGIMTEAVSFDRGLSYNLKSLLIEGGKAARRYASGETKPFQNPILFFLTALGLLFFVMSSTESLVSGEFFRLLEDGSRAAMKIDVIGPDANQVRWLYLIILILVVPFLSLALYVFRDNKEGTYLHSLVSGIFLLSAITIIQSIIILINRVTFHFLNPLIGFYQSGEIESLIGLVVLSMYGIWYLYTFFTKRRLAKTVVFFILIAAIAGAAFLVNALTQTTTIG